MDTEKKNRLRFPLVLRGQRHGQPFTILPAEAPLQSPHDFAGLLLELENGMLFSRIGPKNDVVAFLMPHFADRLPIENFVIYDEKRNLFGIHPAGKPWYLLRGV